MPDPFAHLQKGDTESFLRLVHEKHRVMHLIATRFDELRPVHALLRTWLQGILVLEAMQQQTYEDACVTRSQECMKDLKSYQMNEMEDILANRVGHETFSSCIEELLEIARETFDLECQRFSNAYTVRSKDVFRQRQKTEQQLCQVALGGGLLFGCCYVSNRLPVLQLLGSAAMVSTVLLLHFRSTSDHADIPEMNEFQTLLNKLYLIWNSRRIDFAKK